MSTHHVGDGCWFYGSRGWTNTPLCFVTVQQMAAEWQSYKMASGMEVWMKQRWVIEFLHMENMVPIGIYWHLLNISGDQPVDVSTVRWWVVQFSYDAIIAPVKQLVNPTGSDFCKSGIQALVHYWQKCIANSVDYVEKQCFVAESLLYQMVLLCSLYLL